jgi:hypothetical protein
MLGVAAARGADESREPPLLFSVSVGPAMVSVTEGETVPVAGSFKDPPVTVRPEAHRVFPYGGISFRYPRTFTFEADLDDPDIRSWTLSGNDFKVIYFVFSVPVTPEGQTKETCKSYGNCRFLDRSANLKLAGVTLTGVRVEATIQGNRMTHEAYQVPTKGKGSRLLVFQDWPGDGEPRSREGAEALRMLISSFRVPD